MSTVDVTTLTDLASRALGGSVTAANDELFAQRENLIRPEAPVFDPSEFGHKGKVYDGWETRRRRTAVRDPEAHDWAVVRLGAPGIIHGVVVDTAFFRGNYPPHVAVQATSVEGYPDPEELLRATWVTVVAKSPARGDTANVYPVDDPHRFTHVRLSIYPDGGVARFRVYGEPHPDPRLLTGTIDLAALENGGDVIDCSNMFYSSPKQILQPGRAQIMGDGWENARRRDDHNDHVIVRLGARGLVRRIEVDTSYFVGNAAGWASLRGIDGDPFAPADEWTELVPKTRLQPDTRHFFRVGTGRPVSHVRLDVFPDGGLARLRVNGEVAPDALTRATVKWLDTLPEKQAVEVLTGAGGLSFDEAAELIVGRPFIRAGSVPAELVTRLLNG